MKLIKEEKGFTLVELAIVMAIIGLLIGGILKGQELMENARVASTVSQIKSYEAAVTTFRDTYSALPGDMPNPQTRLSGCNANCTPVAATAGDQVIGLADNATLGNGITATTPLPGGASNETTLFWVHLLLADLIGGVTDSAIRVGNISAWGETHPAAKIGGGFFVGHSDGNNTTINPFPGRPAAPNPPATVPAGMVLILRNSVVGAVNQTAGVQPLSPLRAAQIDRKIDDGQSSAGTVQAYGVTNSCYATLAGGAISYQENVKSKDCGLVIQIQG